MSPPAAAGLPCLSANRGKGGETMSELFSERIPPQSIEAEQAVLGAVFLGTLRV